MAQDASSSTKTPRPKFPIGLILAILAGLVLLALVIWAGVVEWRGAAAANPTSHMTVHGWIALSIAFVMTLVVGGGLMALAFYSARKGYDDRAGGEED